MAARLRQRWEANCGSPSALRDPGPVRRQWPRVPLQLKVLQMKADARGSVLAAAAAL